MANTACVNNCVSHHKTKLMATPYFLQIASPYAEKALQRVNILVTFIVYNFQRALAGWNTILRVIPLLQIILVYSVSILTIKSSESEEFFRLYVRAFDFCSRLNDGLLIYNFDTFERQIPNSVSPIILLITAFKHLEN